MHCTRDKNQRSGRDERFMCQVNTHQVNKMYLEVGELAGSLTWRNQVDMVLMLQGGSGYQVAR